MPSPIEVLFARYGPTYRWLATITAMVSAVAVVLSTTIVNVAIPNVMGAFGIDQVKAQWLSTAFLAAMTSTMLLTDWSARTFGERNTVSGALLLFIAGSIIGGLSPNENVMILARVFQGAAAGIIQPMAMIIIFQIFPPERRGAAMGLFGIGVVLAPALGPYVGGVLMDRFDWSAVFFLGVPIAIIALVLVQFFLPWRNPSEPRRGFDWFGFALLCVFLASLLTGLSNGQREGWSSDSILLLFAVSIAAFTGYLWWEWTSDTPMLDLRLFRHRGFSAAAVVSFVLGAGLFGSTYLVPLFVQTIQGLTPTQSGLLMMPAGFALILAFPIAGRLSDRFHPSVLVSFGLLLYAYSSFLTARADMNTAFWGLAWWIILGRIGLGFIFPALSVGGLRTLPQPLLSQGSGAINFTRQLGGAFGVNLLAVALERRTVFHSDALAAALPPGSPTANAYIQTVADGIAQSGLPDSDSLILASQFLGQSIYTQANILGYRDGFLITALVFLLALWPSWMLKRGHR